MYMVSMYTCLIFCVVDAVMVTLLDAGNREMVFVATGVLINFMMDSDNRCLLRQENGILK